MCVTIPDVAHVVDANLCRESEDYHDILEFSDTPAPKRVQLQRAGRAGRVKPGGYTRIQVRDAMPPMEARLPTEAVAKVIVMEDHHLKLQASECTLCPIGDDTIALARAQVAALGLPSLKILEALSQISLPLRDSAVLLRAMEYGVGYEAAAILAVKSAGRWKGAEEFELQELVCACTESQAARGSRPNPCGDGAPSQQDGANAVATVSKIRFQDKVQALFKDLVAALSIAPSRDLFYGPDERLAIAFLVCPERLVWSRDGLATFLGADLQHSSQAEYFVSIFVSSTFRGLRCNFSLPLSEWAVRQSGVARPTLTANYNGDSTLGEFRFTCCARLRHHGRGKEAKELL